MSDDLQPPRGPAACPKCGTNVRGGTEKPFGELEAFAGQCEKCGLTTVFGSDKWVQFPICPCQKCASEVEHEDCPCTSAQFKAYLRADRRAVADLRIVAREAHEIHMSRITPKMLDWRNHQLDTNPTPAVRRASSGELAVELTARGWNVDAKVKRSPGRTGTLKGCPSVPLARELESRVGPCVLRPEGAK